MTDGVLKDLEIAPGINKNVTPYQGQALYIDGDKVRFYRGTAQKIGGWGSITTTANASGVPRAIHTWVDLQGQKQLAIGTNTQLALFRGGTDYIDITPSAFLPGLASNIVGFGWGSSPWGGDVAPVSTVTSADFGWGEGPTSTTSATPGRIEIKLTEWSLDNFGEDLISNYRGGRIYRWRRSRPIDGSSVVNNSPAANLISIAEPAPYLVAYGTCTESGPFDPLLVRWPSLSDFSDWNASAGNDSGDFRIQGGSEILGVIKTKRETLILTDDVVYSQRFVGGESPFAFERLANNAGIIARNAGIEVNSTVYWMGNGSFFRYYGAVEPIRTTLDEALFDRDRSTSINFFQKDKIYAGINSKFNELIWLYPSRDSEECDRYVIYNYIEDLWYDGTLDRTTWTNGDIFELPIATNASATLYEHELGKNADGEVLVSWVKTGVFDIDDGDKLLFINKFVPDTVQTGPLSLTLQGRKYPNDALISKGPYEFSQSTKRIDLRLRARQMQFTVSSSSLNGDYDFGIFRVNIRPDGER